MAVMDDEEPALEIERELNDEETNQEDEEDIEFSVEFDFVSFFL